MRGRLLPEDECGTHSMLCFTVNCPLPIVDKAVFCVVWNRAVKNSPNNQSLSTEKHTGKKRKKSTRYDLFHTINRPYYYN